jgi:hypothetical protein
VHKLDTEKLQLSVAAGRQIEFPCAGLQETHEWDDPPGTDIQAYDPQAAARQLGIPTGVDYYAMLEVTADADAATIERQYYILARKWHPGGGSACIDLLALPACMACVL